MKQTTTIAIAIVVLCALCATTLMSGCLGTYDASDTPTGGGESSVDSVLDSVTSHKDATLVKLGLRSDSLEVRLYDDGTAKVVIPNNKGDIIMPGTWTVNGEYSDHNVYDMVGENVEFRLELYDDGHATAYILELGFPRHGDPFKGVWERVSGDDGLSSSASDMFNDVMGIPVPPLDVTLDLGSAGIIHVALNDDGSAVVSTIVDGRTSRENCEWRVINAQGNTRTFDLVGMQDFTVSLFDTGQVTAKQMGSPYQGTWESR